MSRDYSVFHAINIRRDYLRAKLDILGFADEKCLDKPLDPTKGYHVLGRVGSALEEYSNPARAVLDGREDSDEVIEKFLKGIEEEDSFMKNQDELIYKIRGFYPEFGLHMVDKVSPEEWEFYTKMMQKTGKLIRDLTIGSVERDLTILTEQDEKEVISELIDSHDFSRACKIEDEFMTQELDEFKKAVREYGFEDERVKNTTPCVILAELVRESERVANKKRKYISNYEKYDKFVKGLKGNVTIRSKEHYNKGEERDDG